MALACWGNYEGYHVEMDTIYLHGMINTYDSKTVGPRGSNLKWDNDAHVRRNATTGDDFCFPVGDSKTCGTTCNEPEVRGSKAYGDFNGRPVQGGVQVFSGGKALADVRGLSVINNFSSGDGPRLGVQVLLACEKRGGSGMDSFLQFHGSKFDSLDVDRFGGCGAALVESNVFQCSADGLQDGLVDWKCRGLAPMREKKQPTE